MATASDIQNLYIAYFNRPADVAGLAYWQTSSLSLVQIAQSFSQQAEYASVFSSSTTRQIVNSLYINMFNHSADAAGLNYWESQIYSGAVSFGGAAIAILNGALGSDQIAIQAKNTTAAAFTSAMVNNAQAQAAYNSTNGSFGFAKTWLAGVVDASTSVAATGALATTTNNYKTTGGDTVVLGAGTQTLNFYNTSGNEVAVIGGTSQTVNQVAKTPGTLTVNTSNNNTVGLAVNGTNAMGGTNITLTDAGKSSLSAAALNGVGTVNLFAGNGEVLMLSPSATLTVNQATAAATLNVNTAQNVTVNQASTSDIILGGVANYTVTGGTTGAITANGTGGSLKVIDTANNHTITSSVATTIDASVGAGTAGYHADTLAGSGNFTVIGAGFQNINVIDGGLAGSLNVVTAGTNMVGYFEGTGGNAAVSFTLGGTGMVSIYTNTSHITTVNGVSGVNNFVSIGGTGTITYNAAPTGNSLLFAGGSNITSINLSATGNGLDDIHLNSGGGVNLGSVTTGLTTITNFKASGADKIHWGASATSLSTMTIASSDLASLAANIQANVGSLTANDGKAFIITVANGAAAGTYLYQHANASSSVAVNDLIVKLVGAGTIVASDLMGGY
ncbi:DUF4214 domain-containing protein [Undibacterium sp. CY18W]|uniref:DUF4214 domain-containing protein n=1 Tax=Undibacterium hunanense TaxID=2762292 RepID=A0ABR6ZXD5_9BURK|nr:DUF4214 domain-containing protein [Undibacterium hunanense]MBC3920502.1 DUF4214 domain-containing protein [Undibacterium hunanense]